MSIIDLCSGLPVMIDAKENLQMAAYLMERKSVGCLVIVEDKEKLSKPLGILTDRDIVVSAVAKDLSMTETSVSEIMSKDPISVPKDAGVGEVVSLMREKGVRRVVITEPDGSLCGVVSTDDLVQMVGEEMFELGELFQSQVFHQDHTRTAQF